MRMFWSFFSNTDNKHVRGAFTENETWKWKHTKCLLRQNMITFGTKMSLNWKNCSVFFWLLPTLNSVLKHWRASESFASVGAQIKKITYFCYLPYEHSYCWGIKSFAAMHYILFASYVFIGINNKRHLWVTLDTGTMVNYRLPSRVT